MWVLMLSKPRDNQGKIKLLTRLSPLEKTTQWMYRLKKGLELCHYLINNF